MLFKYKIKLELDVEFDAPLLGTDTTLFRRKQADGFAKKALQEIIGVKSHVVNIDREINEDNLKGYIKATKHMETHKKD